MTRWGSSASPARLHDLPPYVDTFGFQTARHYGVEIVKNLMVDARTTSRWYFVIAMGRKAGHLALGIGKAAGATLTLIPEEIQGRRIRLKEIVDTLAGAIIKRVSYGRRDGVAVIAEGLVLGIDTEDLAQLDEVEKDAHGNVRIAEVNIGEILKAEVSKRLKGFGIKATDVAKNIGYKLRCAGNSSRCPSAISSIRSPGGRRSAWWTSTPRATRLRAGT
jgi:6-phosphofructokinase